MLFTALIDMKHNKRCTLLIEFIVKVKNTK